MLPATNRSVPVSNRLLAKLPRKEYQHLLTKLELTNLTFGSAVYEPGDIIRHVYFPTSGVVSLLATEGEGTNLEVGMVGREGMVGLPVFMGVKTSRNRAVVQGAGVALRMKATALRKECENGGGLPRLLRRYTHSRLTQTAQAAVCNRFHSIDARLARWLLTTRDGMEAEKFRLTQEFLSSMLGVRREGVNKAAGNLQREKLISYSRGILTILQPAKLEAIVCQCYRITKEEYDSFLPE
jgi:CRP-like cAMP-binding protein